MIHLLVTISVKPEFLDDFYALAQSHQAASIQEDGCIRFDVVVDRERLEYALIEIWYDQASLDAHRQTQHYWYWREMIEPMEESPRRRQEYTTLFDCLSLK